MTKPWIEFPLLWLVQMGTWMVLICDTSLRDIALGAAAATLSSLAIVRTQRRMKVQFKPTAGQLAQAWRIPWATLTGTADVLQAMLMQCFGRSGADSVIAAVPFDFGGGDDRSAGRRALAVTYTTITPNSIVLGWRKGEDGKESYMLYHQVKPGPVRPLMINLGAKP